LIAAVVEFAHGYMNFAWQPVTRSSTGENAVGKNSANLSAIAAIGTSDVVIYHG